MRARCECNSDDEWNQFEGTLRVNRRATKIPTGDRESKEEDTMITYDFYVEPDDALDEYIPEALISIDESDMPPSMMELVELYCKD